MKQIPYLIIYFKKLLKYQVVRYGALPCYAESALKLDKKDEFIFLKPGLKIDIKSSKEFQLTNVINKNRAEWLLENIDEFLL